jgi:hypothetical protein
MVGLKVYTHRFLQSLLLRSGKNVATWSQLICSCSNSRVSQIEMVKGL